jgi:hypothetical protein
MLGCGAATEAAELAASRTQQREAREGRHAVLADSHTAVEADAVHTALPASEYHLERTNPARGERRQLLPACIPASATSRASLGELSGSTNTHPPPWGRGVAERRCTPPARGGS